MKKCLYICGEKKLPKRTVIQCPFERKRSWCRNECWMFSVCPTGSALHCCHPLGAPGAHLDGHHRLSATPRAQNLFQEITFIIAAQNFQVFQMKNPSMLVMGGEGETLMPHGSNQARHLTQATSATAAAYSDSIRSLIQCTTRKHSWCLILQ